MSLLFLWKAILENTKPERNLNLIEMCRVRDLFATRHISLFEMYISFLGASLQKTDFNVQ